MLKSIQVLLLNKQIRLSAHDSMGWPVCFWTYSSSCPISPPFLFIIPLSNNLTSFWEFLSFSADISWNIFIFFLQLINSSISLIVPTQTSPPGEGGGLCWNTLINFMVEIFSFYFSMNLYCRLALLGYTFLTNEWNLQFCPNYFSNIIY